MLELFPNHIQALVFVNIAIIGAAVYGYFFVFRQKIVAKTAAYWLLISSAAFIVGNIWLLSAVVALLCYTQMPKQPNTRLSYYFLLLPILPAFKYNIVDVLPGIKQLFVLTYPRLLALLILLPMFLKLLKKRRRVAMLTSEKTDLIVLAYVLLLSILAFRLPSLTSSLRAIFTLGLDVLIPYYVISRYIFSVEDIKQVLMAMTITAVFLSFLGIFEQGLTWWFYRFLPELLSFQDLLVSRHTQRSGLVRIGVTMGSIHLSYFLSLTLAALVYFRDVLPRRTLLTLLTGLLILTNIVFTGSRAGMMMAAIVLALYLYQKIRKQGVRWLIGAGFCACLIGVVLAPNQLIFGESSQSGSFNYRVRLITDSMGLIKQNLLFGVLKPTDQEGLESLRQGQGIIDIVNTYIAVVLSSGVIGLGLFVAAFAVPLFQLRRLTRRMRRRSAEDVRLLGYLLLAMLVSTMLMIATVSSISYTPIYYWSLLALISAYIRLHRRPAQQPQPTPTARSTQALASHQNDAGRSNVYADTRYP